MSQEPDNKYPYGHSVLSNIWRATPAIAESASHERLDYLPFDYEPLSNQMLYGRLCLETRAVKITRDGYETFAIEACKHQRFFDGKGSPEPREDRQKFPHWRDLSRADAGMIVNNILLSWRNQGFKELPSAQKNLVRLPQPQLQP